MRNRQILYKGVAYNRRLFVFPRLGKMPKATVSTPPNSPRRAKRKHNPGSLTTKRIEECKSQRGALFHEQPFQRRMREILATLAHDGVNGADMRMQATAANVLQRAAEEFLTVQLTRVHALMQGSTKRPTLNERYLRTLLEIDAFGVQA
jgi:histone H3/H4